MAANSNPGNFSNRPHGDVENIARKGGQSSRSGGFASMDPEKQRNIASKGGQASSGSFQVGDPRARAAGQKGGSRTLYGLDQPEEQPAHTHIG
ncbi:hypothetical protein BDV26DRAFT_271117 [Aspergillus bertholletiae]|uniref:Conidiation-specific protein 10 n=1 Tax=Aspergillus bertholletiae TaxID=1226010 RepID=A0A5N7AVG5_9EURO|nr:hypothetical protein BDV26DRAFT_271117 [Aspergillus bertholletiae]